MRKMHGQTTPVFIYLVPFSLTFAYGRSTSESELQAVTWEALTWHTIPSDVPSNVAEQ